VRALQVVEVAPAVEAALRLGEVSEGRVREQLETQLSAVQAAQTDKAALQDHIRALEAKGEDITAKLSGELSAREAEKAALEARVGDLDREQVRLSESLRAQSDACAGLQSELGRVQEAAQADKAAHGERIDAGEEAPGTVADMVLGRYPRRAQANRPVEATSPPPAFREEPPRAAGDR
jgi:predicted  nucleic acid-binding Zn-ribbon protein